MGINRNRILMLLQNCPYPQDDRVRRESRALVSKGYQVSVVAPLGSGQSQQETIDGVHVYRFKTPLGADSFTGYLVEYGYAMIAIFLKSLSIFFKEGFDVVHTHHPPDTFAFIGLFYKLLGKQYVLDHHDLAPELYYARFKGNGNRIVYKVLTNLEKFACKVADHIITTNESYKLVEMQRSNIKEQHITIVRNGPDLNELTTNTPDEIVQRNGKTIIGYVGVTGTQDGVDNLLRSLHHLRYRLGRNDFHCIIVGSGDALPYLKSLSSELEIEENIHFTGWIYNLSEVAQYLNAMDICVASEPSDPYNDRSTAAKIMEYMAFGKPVVSFDLPEHRYTAQDAALYAHPNDEAHYAEQILSLMDNPKLRRAMGSKGLARIKNSLSWSHQSKILIDLYRTLLPLENIDIN